MDPILGPGGRGYMGDDCMKKLIVIGLTALVAMFATIAAAPSASAYPEVSCTVEVDAQVVDSEASFTATASSQQTTVDDGLGRTGADSVDWTMTFNGETRTGSGSTFKQTFEAPAVTKTGKYPLTATAVQADGETTCSKTVEITVVPGGTTVVPPGGGLPNTGGPHLWLLVAGLALLALGGAAVRQSRKRHDQTLV